MKKVLDNNELKNRLIRLIAELLDEQCLVIHFSGISVDGVNKYFRIELVETTEEEYFKC